MKTFVMLAAAAALSAQTRVDLRTQGKSVDFSTAASTRVVKTGTILPGSCGIGELFFKTDGAAGSNLYGCNVLNSWVLEGGNALPSIGGQAGRLLATDGTNLLWVPGDVSLIGGVSTVTQFQGRPIASTAPTNLQALVWNSSSGRWEPQTQSGGGSSLPSQVGNTNKLLTTDGTNPSWAALAGDLTCSSPGACVVQQLQSRPVASTAPTGGQVIAWNSTLNRWEPATLSLTNATQLQGRTVAATAPANTQALVWNSSTAQWEPQNQSGGGGSGLPAQASNAGKVLTTDGTNASWAFPAGDESGPLSARAVTQIQGRPFSSAAPVGGQVWTWNGFTLRWEPANPSGSAGTIAVSVDGTLIGARGTVNYVTGNGISRFVSDTGTQINVQEQLDTAFAMTIPNAQSGAPTYCASASASGVAYTCSLARVLTTYTAGMVIAWRPDVNGSGGATTLSIDTLPAAPITLADGSTNPGGSDIVAGRFYLLAFDGTNFRKMF